MKKVLIILCLVALSFLTISCEKEKEEVKIIVPLGTPYLAISGLLDYEKVEIQTTNGASNLQAALTGDSYDIVIAPLNLGANLYKKGSSQYKLASILTLSNAYIVTKEENKLDSISDLNGKKVKAFAESGIPASTLKKAFNDNNLDTTNISYLSSSSDLYSAFLANGIEEEYILLSEPEVSKLAKEMNIKKLDLSQELNQDIIQACIFVNPISSKTNQINEVLNKIKENVTFLNDSPQSYADKIIPLDYTETLSKGMGKDIIINSIPLSNIVYLEGKANQEEVLKTLKFLLGEGYNISDEFYY